VELSENNPPPLSYQTNLNIQGVILIGWDTYLALIDFISYFCWHPGTIVPIDATFREYYTTFYPMHQAQ